MFVVVTGTSTVTRRGEALGTVGPGDFFGEMAVLTGGRRTATVTSVEPARVLYADRRMLSTLMEQSDQIAARMLAPVARRPSPDQA